MSTSIQGNRTILVVVAVGLLLLIIISPVQVVSPTDDPRLPWPLPVVSQDEFEITWTSRETPQSQPIEDGISLVGDGIRMNVTYLGEVQSMNVTFTSSIDFCSYDQLVKPDEEYSAFSGSIDTTQFAWERIDGIKEGDLVNLRCAFSGGNNDVMAWWADTENSTWTYENNILGNSMVTAANPETTSFEPDRSRTLMVGIYNTQKQGGIYTLNVSSTTTIFETNDNSIWIDASVWGTETTTNMSVAARDNLGSLVNASRYDLHVENFFRPEVSHVEVSGNETAKMISWNLSDRNTLESHLAEVYLSADLGQTYQLLASRIAEDRFFMDFSGFTYRENYRIRIRVTDSRGLRDMGESEPFSAGDLSLSVEWNLTWNGFSDNFSVGTPFTINWTLDYYVPTSTFIAYFEIYVNGSFEAGWSDGYDGGNGQIPISYRFEGIPSGRHNITLWTALMYPYVETYSSTIVSVIDDPPTSNGTPTTTTTDRGTPGTTTPWAISPLSLAVTALGVGIMVLFGIPLYRERTRSR